MTYTIDKTDIKQLAEYIAEIYDDDKISSSELAKYMLDWLKN